MVIAVTVAENSTGDNAGGAVTIGEFGDCRVGICVVTALFYLRA